MKCLLPDSVSDTVSRRDVTEASGGRMREGSVQGQLAFSLGRPKEERALGRRSRECWGTSCLRVDFVAFVEAQGRFQGVSACKSLS